MSDATTPRRPRGTGSIRLLKGTWYVRYFHKGRRIEHTTGYREPDRAKAEALLRAKVKDADTPRFIAPRAERVRFEQLCDLLRRDYVKKQNRSRIEYKLEHLRQAFGGWQALAITDERVEQYIEQRLAEHAAIATVNRELAALRRMFRLAMKSGKLPFAPSIELRRENNARQGFLDLGDFEIFLAALRQRDPIVAEIAECAFFSLLRRANVLALTWPLVRPEVDAHGQLIGGELRVPGTMTKQGRDVIVPLTDRLLALFARRWAARTPMTRHIFHRNGRPVVRFDTPWNAAAAAIGRPGFLFHDLRRSGARALRRLGVDEQTIMRLGGWKTRSMFTRYAIVDSRDLAEAQAKLSAALAGAPPPIVTPLDRRRRR